MSSSEQPTARHHNDSCRTRDEGTAMLPVRAPWNILVDVVINVEGDRHARLRLVRAQKNRFGPADEVGCLTSAMTELRELSDPSELFISRRHDPVSGTGSPSRWKVRGPRHRGAGACRPASPGTARRATSGLDTARVAMVLADARTTGRHRTEDPRHLHRDTSRCEAHGTGSRPSRCGRGR